MKLSVAVITYNHRPFIEQALDSVLQQKVDGSWEIVIGDDGSTDGTVHVLRSYQRRHPDIIRLILTETNPGDGGRGNYMSTISACQGEYVAYLDGDDYWLGDDKLGSQLALMESQEGLSGCAHPVLRQYADGRQDRFGPPPGSSQFSLAEITGNFTFIHGCSFMFRRSAIPKLPGWFADSHVKLDDWALTVLCALDGDIGYVEQVGGVYRKHEDGLWTGQQALMRLSWDLVTREFVTRQISPTHRAGPPHNATFECNIARADQAIENNRRLFARWHLSAALLHFPYKSSLSATYLLIFLIETWAGLLKPVLLRMRQYLRG